MKIFLCALALHFLTACSGKKKSAPTGTADSVKVNGASAAQSIDTILTKNSVVASGNTWRYEKKVDKEGRTVYKASIISPTLLEFEFPYNGGSVVTMTLRKREDDTHVYIQVSKGQFNRSFQEGKAHVRFDGGAPITYAFSAAENGSANVIFFDSEQALIRKIKAARTMIVAVEFAGQGTRQIAFKTAGLQWNY